MLHCRVFFVVLCVSISLLYYSDNFFMCNNGKSFYCLFACIMFYIQKLLIILLLKRDTFYIMSPKFKLMYNSNNHAGK